MDGKKQEKKSFRSKIAAVKRYLPLYFMMLPAMAYLLINNYLVL